MSLKLRDLIRQVRSCKTAAEERAVIARESAMIRTAIREEQEQYRHRNVAKLLFMHMLGYPTHFGQLECLKLIASPHFPEKRIGYLGLLLLLSEEADVLMLATNTLKNDMNSPNRFVAGLALVAFGNLATADMGRDLATEVDRHLKSGSPYLRKKAALAMARCLTKVPDMIEDFADRMVSLLKDRSHGVLLTAVQLLTQVCLVDPAICKNPTFAKLVPTLVRMIRDLLTMGYAPELEVGGVADPFLQVQLLTLLRLFGKDSDSAAEHMNDVLAQVSNSTVTDKNAGNAVVYECVRTIMSVRTEDALRAQAVDVLGRFLTNRDNNIRYVALNSLARAVQEDPDAVGRHRETIVGCLKDPDVSIRTRALELIYRLVGPTNVEELTAELLNYLVVAAPEQRTEICSRILRVTERFAPDDRWRLDTLVTLLTIAGRQCERHVLSSAIVYVSRSSDDLRAYATHRLAKAVRDDDGTQEGLLIVGIWCVGEYGDLLLQPYQYTPRAVAGEGAADVINFSALTATEVVTIVENVTKRKSCPEAVIEFGLTCFVKLSERLANVPDSAEIAGRLKLLIQTRQTSYSLEMQIRSCEYSMLLDGTAVAGARKALARMPMVDATLLQRKKIEKDEEAAEDGLDVGGGVAQGNSGGEESKGDLLDLNDIFGGGGGAVDVTPSQLPSALGSMKHLGTSAPAPAAKSDLDLLSDIFSAPAATPMPMSAPIPASNGIVDLFGPTPVVPSATPAPIAAMPAASAMLPVDIFAPVPAAPVPTPMTNGQSSDPFAIAATPTNPLVSVFDGDGLSIRFECVRGSQPNLTELRATFGNSSSGPITDVSLQIAVPKYLKMQIFPPSSTAVPGGGEATQQVNITNSMVGQKKIVLKIKLAYVACGTKKDHIVTCSSFPEGY